MMSKMGDEYKVFDEIRNFLLKIKKIVKVLSFFGVYDKMTINYHLRKVY